MYSKFEIWILFSIYLSCVLQFKISSTIIHIYTLMTSIELLVRKFKDKRTFISELVSRVHFLNYVELKMRYIHVAPFVYRKCILKYFGYFVFTLGVPIWYIYTSRLFVTWLVHVCLLEIWFLFSIYWSRVFAI